MPAHKRMYIVVRREDFEDKTAWQTLDVLRYDRLVVEEHAFLTDSEHNGFIILSCDQVPNIERLRSYHIRVMPAVVEFCDKSEATGYCHQLKRQDMERITKGRLADAKTGLTQ